MAVPEVTPVVTPVPVTTVATLVLLLLHVPPDVPSVRCVVSNWQTAVEPPIADVAEFYSKSVIAEKQPTEIVAICYIYCASKQHLSLHLNSIRPWQYPYCYCSMCRPSRYL